MDVQPGHPGNTTPEQDKTKASLAAKLGPLLNNPAGELLIRKNGGHDCFVLRLLRARKFDEEAAEILCKEIVQYRKDHNLDTLLETVVGTQKLQDPNDPSWGPDIKDPTVKKVLPLLPCGRHGFTKMGQPLEIWRISCLRPADLLNHCERDEIFKWWHFHLESGLQCSLDGASHFNKPILGSVIVFDLKGFGARHLNTQVLKLLVSLFGIGQSKYPESLSKIFILNAPTLFAGVWNTVKPVLNERTRKKIMMTNKATHEELNELVPPNQMPQFLGGQCPCNIGEKITSTGHSFESTTVGARSEKRVPVEVEQGEFLGWEFFTENNDIKFGVFYFKRGAYSESTKLETGEIVVEVAKASGSGQQTITDCKAGTYVLAFDNRYSMMTSKQLRYSVEKGSADGIPQESVLSPVSGMPSSGRAYGESVVTGEPTPPVSPVRVSPQWK